MDLVSVIWYKGEGLFWRHWYCRKSGPRRTSSHIRRNRRNDEINKSWTQCINNIWIIQISHEVGYQRKRFRKKF